MFFALVILFTVLPALELALLIKIGGHIGVINTIFIIISTGVLGAYLARLQGFLTLNKIQASLNEGKMPSSELMDGLMILVGGIVLLTPGFITDTIGFLLLIPWTRALVKIWLQQRFENMIKNGQAVTFTSFRSQRNEFEKKDDDIIDI
ncbi:MAG: membrane protein FxsA [Candidatus Omnitrophica bacterium]|nr:membrane protein FxsA [Candidatus Omnitrophota bacterium]